MYLKNMNGSILEDKLLKATDLFPLMHPFLLFGIKNYSKSLCTKEIYRQ